MFTESQPALAYSCIFKAMWTNVTKPVYRRPRYIAHIGAVIYYRKKPLVRNVPFYALHVYSPDLIIQFIGLINFSIKIFIQNIATKPEKKTDDGNTIRILVLPFKDQIVGNAVHRQLRDISNRIAVSLQPKDLAP